MVFTIYQGQCTYLFLRLVLALRKEAEKANVLPRLPFPFCLFPHYACFFWLSIIRVVGHDWISYEHFEWPSYLMFTMLKCYLTWGSIGLQKFESARPSVVRSWHGSLTDLYTLKGKNIFSYRVTRYCTQKVQIFKNIRQLVKSLARVS